MKTQEQIVSGQDSTSFWRLYWETTLPNSITVEQWLEVQEYIDSKTLEFITEQNPQTNGNNSEHKLHECIFETGCDGVWCHDCIKNKEYKNK